MIFLLSLIYFLIGTFLTNKGCFNENCLSWELSARNYW